MRNVVSVNLFLLYLFLFSIALLPLRSVVAAENPIILEVGQSKVVKVDFVINKLATGAHEICNVTRTGDKEVLLNASGQGKTNILIWDARQVLRREIVVSVRDDVNKLTSELENIVRDVEGVRIRQAGNNVVVEGEVFSKDDLQRVSDAVADHEGVVNYVSISPMVLEIAASEIKNNMRDKGVQVQVRNNKILLEGYVTTEARKERASQVASVYTSNYLNLIQVVAPSVAKSRATPSALMQVTLSVMEIEKDAMKTFGIHWNPGGTLGAAGSFNTATGSSSSTAGTISGVLFNLFPKMQNIKERGRGRSIFEQSVTVKSGNHASFFVGDEIPIPVVQGTGAISIEYKKVGLTLKVLPILGARGRIDTQVEIESSSIANQNSGNAPWIKSSQLQTVVFVNNGESIVLGGLIGQREVSSRGSVPPGDGSALFQLNKSESFMNGKSEVLVCVTPRILHGARDSKTGIGNAVDRNFKKEERKSIGTSLP